MLHASRRSSFDAFRLLGFERLRVYYYLRTISTGEWLAYPPKLTVELGSYVDGEAHGWAR